MQVSWSLTWISIHFHIWPIDEEQTLCNNKSLQVTELIFCYRLDERKRRKEFILERGLLDVKRQQEMDNRRSKEERELYQEARVFLRYHSMEEHEALLGGLNTERKIRQHIAELQVETFKLWVQLFSDLFLKIFGYVEYNNRLNYLSLLKEGSILGCCVINVIY